MKKSSTHYLYVICTLSLLTGCAGCTTSLSPDVYTTRSAGHIHRIEKGVITNRRIVNVTGNNDDLGIGAITGGALGAIAGSQIGGGNGSLAAGIGGALLGGLAGNQVQQGLSTQTAMEYIIKLKNNSLISIVQAPDPSFHCGQHVLVQYNAGGRPRLIADPDYAAR